MQSILVDIVMLQLGDSAIFTRLVWDGSKKIVESFHCRLRCHLVSMDKEHVTFLVGHHGTSFPSQRHKSKEKA